MFVARAIRKLWGSAILMVAFALPAFAQDLELIAAADSSYAAGDYEQLLADCDAAIAVFPDTAVLYYYRGIARDYLGDPALALSDLSRSIELEPMAPEPFVARARLHYYGGRREEAFKDIRACLKRDPDFLEAYLLRIEMNLDEMVLSEAWQDLEVARKLAPRDAEVFCLRSEYYLLEGNPRQAIKEAGTAIKLAPDAAMGYLSQATAYEAIADYANALSDIDLAIRLEPEQYSLLATRAMILDGSGDREGAMKVLARYIEKDSLAWDAYLTRSWLEMSDSNWAAAETDLFRAQELQPQEPSIPDQLGYLYVLKGDFEPARATLAPLVQQHPDMAFAHANLGYALLELGDADAALKSVQQAIKLDDMDPLFFYYRAAIHHDLKRPTKACEDLDTAEQLGYADYYGEESLKAMRKKACGSIRN
ncbi:MAG: tetratricopeptide repeat protein [Bacteroidia bacterium]